MDRGMGLGAWQPAAQIREAMGRRLAQRKRGLEGSRANTDGARRGAATADARPRIGWPQPPRAPASRCEASSFPSLSSQIDDLCARFMDLCARFPTADGFPACALYFPCTCPPFPTAPSMAVATIKTDDLQRLTA